MHPLLRGDYRILYRHCSVLELRGRIILYCRLKRLHSLPTGHVQHQHGVHFPRRVHSVSRRHVQRQHRRHVQRDLYSVLPWFIQSLWCI